MNRDIDIWDAKQNVARMTRLRGAVRLPLAQAHVSTARQARKGTSDD